MRCKRTTDHELVRTLDRECFPEDDPIVVDDGCVCWVAGEDAFLVARAGPQARVEAGSALLERVGVLPAMRGRGLQRRLMRTWQRWCQRIGAVGVTYTLTTNVISSRNMIACGLELFWPYVPWVGPDVLYWRTRNPQRDEAAVA